MYEIKNISIQGIWAEYEEDNALYWIEKDFIYFIDHMDTPIPYKYEQDTLYFMFEPTTIGNRVIRLTLDSLWIEREALMDTIKLYKRE